MTIIEKLSFLISIFKKKKREQLYSFADVYPQLIDYI